LFRESFADADMPENREADGEEREGGNPFITSAA
jgi:hypothetical protein